MRWRHTHTHTQTHRRITIFLTLTMIYFLKHICLRYIYIYIVYGFSFVFATDLAKMSLSSWSDTNCPRLATNSVEQGGWGCCWLGGEGSAGEGRNGRPCGPSVNVGWKRANPNVILLRIVTFTANYGKLTCLFANRVLARTRTRQLPYYKQYR